MNMTKEVQRKRIDNINEAHSKVKKFYKKLRINNYLPGQVTYKLTDYPLDNVIEPTEYDENLIKDLKNRGFNIIQVHSDWHDWNQVFGGDDYSACDEEGMKHFVELCHKYGIKVLVYLSSAFLAVENPKFNKDFMRVDSFLRGGYTNLAVCWQGSPAWREFVWKNMFDTVERYGFDGIYNDMGHDTFLKNYFEQIEKYGSYDGESDDIPYETELEDFLAMLYNECKRRNLIYKLHIGTWVVPKTDLKVYDYIWVGEGTRNIKDIIPNCKNFDTFVIPGFDRRTTNIEDPELPYVCTIPFVQFPILYHGRPIRQYGKREGITYYDTNEFDGKMTTHSELAVKHWKAHPDEPTYSEWSNIPDDPNELNRATKYLELYKPMVKDESIVRVEIREADFIKSEIPEEVYISMFTNDEQYLVVANLTDNPYELKLDGIWKNRETGEKKELFTVPKNRILFLKKA